MSSPDHIEDFTLFLFLHMGCVDGSLHPNERETIVEKMQELFPNSASADLKLMDTEMHYRLLKPGAAEGILTEGFQKFSQVDSGLRKNIYAALFDILNANGRVNEEETQILKLAKSWLLP